MTHVLIVDDDHDSADSLAMLLSMNGHETRTAYDGAAALQIAAEFRPDLVFLDLGMPLMGGLQVARSLRATGECPTLVALSGHGHQEDVAECMSAGFDHHLLKPADILDILQLIERVKAPQALVA